MSGVNQSEPINSLSLCSLSIWVFLEGRGGDCTLNIQTLAPLYITSTYFPSPCQFLAYILSIFWCTHSSFFMVASAFEIYIRKKAFHSSELLFKYIFLHTFLLLVIFSVSHNIEISFFKQLAKYTTPSFPHQSEKFIVLCTLKTSFFSFLVCGIRHSFRHLIPSLRTFQSLGSTKKTKKKFLQL